MISYSRLLFKEIFLLLTSLLISCGQADTPPVKQETQKIEDSQNAQPEPAPTPNMRVSKETAPLKETTTQVVNTRYVPPPTSDSCVTELSLKTLLNVDNQTPCPEIMGGNQICYVLYGKLHPSCEKRPQLILSLNSNQSLIVDKIFNCSYLNKVITCTTETQNVIKPDGSLAIPIGVLSMEHALDVKGSVEVKNP
jgi:hypothetical protein